MAKKKYVSTYKVGDLVSAKTLDVVYDETAELYYICLIDEEANGYKIALTKEGLATLFKDIANKRTLKFRK